MTPLRPRLRSLCASPRCNNEAVAVMYHRLGGVLVRVDHLGRTKHASESARCMECLLSLIEGYVEDLHEQRVDKWWNTLPIRGGEG